ncbi:N-acetylmannosamine kinase [Deinococcus xinjiangensis]|uniref:N-acetylmannosamine kinase n=1 Tax=Deinococcus xinjiangensis TaxID=457454 RepID=A0ABP9VCF9_9DEIO
MNTAAVAVDIGGTSTRVAVVRGTELLERLEMPTEAQRGPEDFISRLLMLLQNLNAPQFPVGVACTGRVHSGLVSAVNTATMPGWVNVSLQTHLSEAMNVPVAVINDAKAAALAEYSACNEAGNFMFITVSTGIGSGLVLNGRLHDTPDGRDVGLGFTHGLNSEFLEYGSSGRGLEKVALSGGYASVAALFDVAEAGESKAEQHLTPPLTALAKRIADADKLLGLQTLCVGGSVGLRAFTRAFLKENLAGLDVKRARFGSNAGLVGAALHVSRLQGE